MATSVEEIKSKLSITEVISSYLKLEKAGLNYRACCPFHNEKTPSFFVSSLRGTYHCFGCGRGGDIFSFVQEIEGLNFPETLKLLAERAGVELEPLTKERLATISQENRLQALLGESANFYFKQLTEQPEILSYLYERGLSKETIKDWRLGFAPPLWRALSDYLVSRSYLDREIEKAGLSISNPKQVGRSYDRFRSRIMFPLFNPAGKVVGFSGRIWGESEQDTAKYINTPQTELYDKSKILYGYHRAKTALRQKNFCIFVEGQMDLLLAHQAGWTNTVAVSGTALSLTQISLVKRLTDQVVLAYDYDLAGLKASRRAIDLLQKENIIVKIAKLPSGQDPADLIKVNPEAWAEAINGAKHYIDFIIDALREEGHTGLALNQAVGENVLPYIKALDKKMEQAHFVKKVAELLIIGEEAVWADLNSLEQNFSSTSDNSENKFSDTDKEKILNPNEERLFGLFYRLSEAKELEQFRPLVDKLLKDNNFVTKKQVADNQKEALMLSAEILYGVNTDLGQELSFLYEQWLIAGWQELLRQKMALVQEAEQRGDQFQVEEQLKECQKLTALINNLKK